MDFIHLVVINVNWYKAVFFAAGFIVLITNIMLTITSLDKNKDDTTRFKILVIAKYIAITFILYGLLYLAFFAGSTINFLSDFIEFINSVINSGLNKLPLGWIMLWTGIPLVSCYLIFTVKGILYYQKRRASYTRHNNPNRTEDTFDFSKLITFNDIRTTKDLRKFIWTATEKPQYGSFGNADWIAIHSNQQKIDPHIKLPKKLNYPSLLINRGEKWEEISTNEALKIIRLYKQRK